MPESAPTTKFSNIGVFFVDPFNAILVGLTSNGFDVAMVLSDIPFNGTLLALAAFPASQTHCVVYEGAFDTDFDGNFLDEIVFDASGICDLVFNRTVLFLDNLVTAGIPLGFNIMGECSEIVVLNTAALKGERDSVEAMTEGLKEGMSSIQEETIEDMRNEGADGDAGLLNDFQQELEE